MGDRLQMLKDMGINLYGLGENVASLGSAAIAEPVAGFAAMYDPVNGAQAIREGMTYQPRTHAGQMYQQGIGNVASAAVKPAMPVIDTWQQGVDIAGRYSPAAGAALQTTPTALAALLGYKPAMQTGRQVSNGLDMLQRRIVANANAPRTLNTGFRGQRGTFAGINALTADKDALAKAQTMIAQGVDPEDVWQETGWGRGADGKWRFEINDKFDIMDDGKEIGSSLNYNNGALSQLANGQIGVARGQQLLNHEDLYAAYPDFKNMEIRNALDDLGFFDNNNTVGVNNRVLSGAVGGRDLGRTNSAHSVLLHELQHAIQQKEGFARGGSPEQFRGIYKNPHDAYKKLAGEVEARMVQNRMHLTPEQRRDTYPFAIGRYGYEDIPKNEQIITFGNNKAMSQRPLTQFEQTHLTAQRNAALPVNQGGLGLAPDNTAMDRARAMGFDVDNPVYHGTGADFPNFRGSTTGKTSGSGVFFTENPSVASTYASSNGGSVIPAMLRTESPVQVSTNGANWNWIKKDAKVNAPRITVADAEGDKLMAELFGDSSPVSIQKKAFKKTVGNLFPEDFKYDDHISTDDLARWANKEGYDSISFDSIKDRGPSGVFANTESALPSKNTAVFDPKNIRSRFAAFDPFNRESANLLAQYGAVAPTAGIAAYLYGQQNKDKQ